MANSKSSSTRTSGLVPLSRWKRLCAVRLHLNKQGSRGRMGFGHPCSTWHWIPLSAISSETTLRRIYASSLGNLPAALIPDRSGIDIVQIYDNSRTESRPALVLEVRSGRIVRIAEQLPSWLRQALGWTQDVSRTEMNPGVTRSRFPEKTTSAPKAADASKRTAGARTHRIPNPGRIAITHPSLRLFQLNFKSLFRLHDIVV
jgi:hypothetical protein